MKRTPIYAFAKTCIQWFLRFFIPFDVYGRDNIPKNGKVLICCNHVSMSDAVRLAFTLHRQIFFMAKVELFRNKALAALLTSLGAFPVQRGKGDKTALNTASALLEKEQAVGIFIEGTRSKTGELLQPKAGAVMLAYNNHAPIVPCCITAKNGGVPKIFHKCIVSYGKLIPPEELGVMNGSGTEFRAASREVMSRIAELREQDLRKFNS
ncbi:MAG TPA: lysophospholipid acyltransferase family protein [Caproiciproducens sp.]|nr:lysophospholipid acyltransferase family protein [Caproiciproducens sp.]